MLLAGRVVGLNPRMNPQRVAVEGKRARVRVRRRMQIRIQIQIQI
ncbi:MAG: hypothetical protein ACKO3T_11705 [Planctomycetaceae bacterium]